MREIKSLGRLVLTLITGNYDDSSYLSVKIFVFPVSQQQPNYQNETGMETTETDTNDRYDNKKRQQRIHRQLLKWESIFVGTGGADCEAVKQAKQSRMLSECHPEIHPEIHLQNHPEKPGKRLIFNIH